ncbi:MAG TPA: hypothetical protein VN622_08450 [Clostridia bacterium]|nr:hypothetical protein [Clostridia bacterium]
MALQVSEGDRLTVTLAPGQRQVLERIAELNSMKLAQVVRIAIATFVEDHRDKQIPLRFPRNEET